MPVSIPQIQFSNTFGHWIALTNSLANAMSTVVVTTNGIPTNGNAIVNGQFTATTLEVGRIQGLGGQINVAAATISFDTTTNLRFNGSTLFNGAVQLQSASTLIIPGANATHRVLGLNANGSASIIGLRLGELNDVSMTGAANGDFITYTSATNSFRLTPRSNHFSTLLANSAIFDALAVGTINAPLNVVGTGASNISNLLYITPAAGRIGVGVPVPLAAIHVAGGIIATGDIQASNVSDPKFKKNVRKITDGLGLVDAIGGYRFQWNALIETVDYASHYEGEEDLGVLATEVRDAIPEAVRTRQDGSLAVDYIKLIPVLLAAVRDLNIKVRRLEDLVKNGDAA
ncbi:MAG: hypothetical protein DDT26_01709 [Dehalococcoidia bacterium]|nr:hypothetical protein [Chloroflexota bacterium]